ncbi:hypothetical protein RZS08_65580, partial [Arthrospira platensis SPKY1]|nr:hypothetical protein [Arthrospira platensis SPKY1]
MVHPPQHPPCVRCRGIQLRGAEGGGLGIPGTLLVQPHPGQVHQRLPVPGIQLNRPHQGTL